jgi:hypothetical protein
MILDLSYQIKVNGKKLKSVNETSGPSSVRRIKKNIKKYEYSPGTLSLNFARGDFKQH